MTTLTEFLLARIAADEDAAEHGRRHNASTTYAQDNYGCLLVDPKRVLAECEAKRWIVEVSTTTVKSHGLCTRCVTCITVRLLALPYADHPDYDPKWRA